ncbi:RHS domain-containing protein, partial [Escherichia coli]
EMTDSDGKIVWETGYQVWGNTIQEKDHGGVAQNLRYQGQYLDRETGLHYNLHRYYDPDVGRFMVTDPIGLAGGNKPLPIRAESALLDRSAGTDCMFQKREIFARGASRNRCHS